MSKPLRLLQVEDSDSDADLILRNLRRAGYDIVFERVQTAAAMQQALSRGPWDVIVSDYRMPDFDAPAALALLQATGADIPFIVVSGTIGEDAAVAVMKAGAHDYLMKDRLTRLAPVVEREIQDAAMRRKQRESEAALRESERVYRLISEHSGDVVWVYDFEAGRFTYVSPSIRQLQGYAPSEYQALSFLEVFVPEAREIAAANMLERVERLKRGVVPAAVEVRQTELLHKNGARVPVEITIWIPTEEGDRLELVGVTRDITERRKSEAALRESSLFHQQVVASASEGLIVYDDRLHILAWNRFMEQMTGIPAERVIGRYAGDVFPFLVENGVMQGLERALAGEVVRSPDFRFDIESTGKTGWCTDTSSPLRDAAGEIIGVIGVVHDLTERKLLQDQFTQMQKMEAIGRLAGGVAHDFNNLLTVINGYSGLMLGRLSEHDPLRSPVQEIHQSGERAAGLTQQLLAFSRNQVIEPKVFNLNLLVSEMRNMLHRIIGEDIQIELKLDSALGQILADEGQFTQVIMNLAVNARDAMPKGGRLNLETRNVEIGSGAIAPATPGSFVRFSVSDNGTGIAPEILQNIFEPFFTTKPVGKGTGLGLSTVHGIVHQCGGWVTVDSTLGQGTTFHVFIPRTHADLASEDASASSPARLRGSETILVVEDQDEVRHFAIEALDGYGYRTLEASQADEAMLIAERHAGPIHLMLTDVVMPHLTGVELAARLKPMRADMHVLYMTGHTEQAAFGEGFFEAGGALLRKPFTAHALVRKIRELLDPPECPLRILVAGEDDAVRGLFKSILEGAGYAVSVAPDAGTTLSRLASEHFDVLVTGGLADGSSSAESLRRIRASHPLLKLVHHSFDGTHPPTTDIPLAEPVTVDRLLAAVKLALA